MKLSGLVLLSFNAAVLANFAVVCPHGAHSNCYPQLFQPSKEWQVIQEGQQIPAGLHVRLNLETGEQEARLMQPHDAESTELALINANEEPQDTSYNHLCANKKTRLVESDLSDYDSSVKELLAFDENTGNYARLNTALDTLIELSHDIDFGVQLATNSRTFFKMVNIAESSKNEEVAEKVFRIMAASLRNNPDATELFLKHHQGRLFSRVYGMLQDSKTSDLVQKRILGMFHALALDSKYASRNMNLGNATTAHDLFTLISLFPNLGDAAKDRIVLILKDLQLIENSELPTESAEEVFSEFLQVFLHSESGTSEIQFQSAYRTLAQLHQKMSLPLKKEFTLWISKEAEERRSGIKQRSKMYSNEDLEFDSFFAQTRHLIFGNPNAIRKQGDEL